MENKSGLHPKGRTLLVKTYGEDTVTKGGIIIAEKAREAQQKAIVVEIAKYCWEDESEPRAVVGEHILISKYSGAYVMGPKDKEEYRIVKDIDVFCGIEVD